MSSPDGDEVRAAGLVVRTSGVSLRSTARSVLDAVTEDLEIPGRLFAFGTPSTAQG